MPRQSRSNSKTRTRAIELRKELTPAEQKLWSRIRNNQLELGVNKDDSHFEGDCHLVSMARGANAGHPTLLFIS